jgi:hypothetical protein
MRALEHVGNRLESYARHALDDTAAIAAASAHAQAQALVVMVDGQAVESIEAQRAAAMALLERFKPGHSPMPGRKASTPIRGTLVVASS